VRAPIIDKDYKSGGSRVA